MYLVPNIHPGSGSAGVPTVQANFAGSPADWTTLDSTSTMPTGGSISRAGNAMLYDSTGKLTYAPNNLFAPSAADTNFIAAGTTPPTIASSQTILGQSSTAVTFTSAMTSTGFAGCRAYSSVTAPILKGTNYVASIYVTLSRPLTGAEAIVVYWTGAWPSATTTITSSNSSGYVGQWVRASGTLAAGATGSVYPVVYLSSVVSSDLVVYVSRGQFEAVTYQTTPSTYVATTASAYYGPRFDYDPVTLQPKGLLVEGTRTNLLNFSQSFATSGGAQNNWADTNITRNSTNNTSPDGTGNALRVTASAANGTIISSAAIGTSAQRVLSVWLRRVTGTGNIQYTLNNGSNWTTQAITSTWARYSFAATTANQQAGFRIVTSGDAIEIWGVQLEAAAFSSSYVFTDSSTVARAAETFSLTGYANRLVEAFYIDEETGGSYSGNSALSTGTVTISPPTFGWVTSLRAYTNAYAGSISTPSWLSFSRAGNAMYYDSTGTLTFAANNLLLNTATLSTQTVTTGIIPTCDVILSFKGTGSVAISGGYTGTLAGTGASDRVFLKFTTTTASLTFTVTGTVTEAQLERVTYQTQPSLYVANTGSQSYGPRYDFDPSTVPATPRGLLIEEQRSNLLTSSQNIITGTNWFASGTSYSSGAIAPDGTASGNILTFTGTTGSTFQGANVTAGQSYTASIWVKGVGASIGKTATFWIWYAGTATGSNAVTNAVLTADWKRITVSSTPTGSGIFYVRLDPEGVNTSVSGEVVYAWGAQLEAGSFATSYIPTTTASVTRAADVAQLTGSALTTLLSSQASIAVEAQTVTTSKANAVFAVSDNTVNNFYNFYTQSGVGYFQIFSGGASQGTMTASGTISANTTFRIAEAIKANNYASVLNGGTVGVNNTAPIPSGMNRAYLGDNFSSGNSLNGVVRSVAIYNQRLPDAILKQKSTVGAPY